MRWTPGGRSSNIEDRRGAGMGRSMGVGGSVLLLVLSLIFGRNFFEDTGATAGPAPVQQGEAPPASESPEEAKMVELVSFVLDDAQETWRKVLPRAGAEYRDAKLVLFRQAVQSACGVGQSAMGPFYCPLDEKVYIDLGFYDALRARFGAPGDFAQAYVIAHEIGHHVQKILGMSERVHNAQQRDPSSANELSVRLELQADCYAGIWGKSTGDRQHLDPEDADEAITAAGAIGDDRIQRQTTGGVHPESFTHGTSAQRIAWFKRGFDSGDPAVCNTFG